MSAEAFLILYEEHGWSVARSAGDEVDLRQVPIATDADLADQAAGVAAVLTELGYEGHGVCLALPGCMVLTARIDCEKLPRRDRHAAMLYRLEEQLPIDAERLTADFLPTVAGRAMGLAVQTAQVRPVIDALTEAGVEVAVVCPAAMLALWQAARDRKDGPPLAILASNSHVDVFRMEQDRPASWHSLPADPAELVDCIRTEMLVSPVTDGKVAADLIGTLEEATADLLRRGADVELLVHDGQSCDNLAARAASAALAGRGAGWVDFRRDALAPANAWQRIAGLLRLAVVLGLVLLAALAGTFCWRGRLYDALARDYERQQADVYLKLFSHRRAPVNVRSALDSEVRRLAGIRGRAGSDLPEQIDALDYLRQIIAALPPALRLRITDVRIGATGILIEGQARDHTGAEVVAQSLRRVGLAVESPRTERLARGGVGFTLAAKPGTSAQKADRAQGPSRGAAP